MQKSFSKTELTRYPCSAKCIFWVMAQQNKLGTKHKDHALLWRLEKTSDSVACLLAPSLLLGPGWWWERSAALFLCLKSYSSSEPFIRNTCKGVKESPLKKKCHELYRKGLGKYKNMPKHHYFDSLARKQISDELTKKARNNPNKDFKEIYN